MINDASQAKTRLGLSVQVGPSEIKLMFKDLYNEIEKLNKVIENLNNEIRKISENRSRSNKDTGRNI